MRYWERDRQLKIIMEDFFDQNWEEAEYDNIRRREEKVKNILLMDKACMYSNGVIEKLWKEKLAKIGHFNDNISRLSNEIDIFKTFELRWRLKIILTNNIVENTYLNWWLLL